MKGSMKRSIEHSCIFIVHRMETAIISKIQKVIQSANPVLLYIFRELHKINIGLCNNLTIETILSDFGRRSGVEDIESFANVFVIANRQGGNIKTILTETKSILCDKIEIEQEIKTMLGATKNQLNIMMIMPLLIVPMSAGFTEGAENSFSNIMVKVGALIAFVIAYIIGRKITSIKM